MYNPQAFPPSNWLKRNMPILYVVGATCLISLLGLAYALLFKSSAAPPANASAVITSNANVTSSSVANTSIASRPNAATPASTPAATPIRSGSSATSQSEIRNLLDGWAATARSHDLDAQMTYYADTLDVYYTRQGGISKDSVRQNRARAFEKYTSLDVNISNVSIAIDKTGETATATFDKTWNFSGEKSFSGSVRQMVWLTRTSGQWLITGEKDLKVNYVSSS
jgi:ketosteroid isomerase-like protein